MSCGVGLRRGSDPVLLWLWCRLAAIAPIRLLAWEPPHATEAALEKAKIPKTNKQTNQKPRNLKHYSHLLTILVRQKILFGKFSLHKRTSV